MSADYSNILYCITWVFLANRPMSTLWLAVITMHLAAAPHHPVPFVQLFQDQSIFSEACWKSTKLLQICEHCVSRCCWQHTLRSGHDSLLNHHFSASVHFPLDSPLRQFMRKRPPFLHLDWVSTRSLSNKTLLVNHVVHSEAVWRKGQIFNKALAALSSKVIAISSNEAHGWIPTMWFITPFEGFSESPNQCLQLWPEVDEMLKILTRYDGVQRLHDVRMWQSVWLPTRGFTTLFANVFCRL